MTTDAGPLAGLDFALVGPGRVGASLAHWAISCGAQCVSVAGRAGSATPAELAGELGTRTIEAAGLAELDVRLVLIAVPDRAIGEVARRLAGRRRGGIALHVSGALGASALAPLSAAGWRVGSFHPLRAFPAVEPDLARAEGTFYALDGDAEARALGRRLADAFAGHAAVVKEEQRTLYHWAATLAAGGVATLYATAAEVGRRIGLPEAALKGYGALAKGALEAALTTTDPAAAITGPVARGDRETFERQMDALRASAPDLLPLAVELARAVIARQIESGVPGIAGSPLAERLRKTDLLDRSKAPMLTSAGPDPA